MAEGECSSPAAGEAAAKVRVVRCPKCEKLIPELTGFNVYRCGGCNTTLQAKQQTATIGSLLEKSDDEMTRFSEEDSVFSRCKGGDNANASPENDQESRHNSEFKLVGGRAEESDRCLPSRTDLNEPFMVPKDQFRKGDSCSAESRSEDRASRFHMCPSKAPLEDRCSNVDGLAKAELEARRGKKQQGESSYGSPSVHQNSVHKGVESENMRGFQTTPRAPLQGFWMSPYPDEGPSTCEPRSIYDPHYGGHIKYGNPPIPEKVENLEQDRAELLRKLDELREQLTKSCKATDPVDDRIPASNRPYPAHPHEYLGNNGWFAGGAPPLNQPSARSSFLNGHDSNMQNYHPTFLPQDEVLGCRLPFVSQPLRGAPYHSHHLCQQRTPTNFSCGQFDPDHTVSYPHPRDVYYHHQPNQPTCSCSHLCDQHWQLPSQVSPSLHINRRDPYRTSAHGFYPVDFSTTLGPDSQKHGTANSSLISRHSGNHQIHVIQNQNGNGCQPLAGGAPFVVCYNCSELLQVPPKLLLLDKDRRKLRCGSCSHVISIEVNGKGLIVSTPEPTTTILEPTSRANGHKNQISVDSYTAKHDGSLHNTRSVDEKFSLASYPPLSVAINEMAEKESGLNLTEAENMERMSSSSSASKDGRSPDGGLYPSDAARSSELLQKSEVNPHISGLPLREHFGYPPSSLAVSRSGIGNRSKRSEQEKVVCVNGSFKQNSVKDVAVATEMDLLIDEDEYPNARLSEDSDEASKDDEHPRMSKGGESFFAGLMKKSFKDFSKSNQLSHRKFKVSVNGHPIPDRLIKKAEKIAGPIQPGEYWYDYTAGFWGVMGQHCLGIIPPFIEELNYPMPKNCAGGYTGVLVNGRELHQKDLDLLAGRGLPTSRDRSYIIDISGKVLDAISGEELDGLGKLAPTVEKMKHGFGMRVPKISSV